MGLSLPTPGIPDLCRALDQASSRFAAMLRRVPDGGRPAVGTWTVAETAAHTASSAAFFRLVARGETEPESLADVAANNAATLAADPERDPAALAARFEAGEQALLDQAAALGGDAVIEVFRGVPAPLSTLLAVELGEVLVHGFDIARAAGLAWPIGRAEAGLAVDGLTPLLPHLVDGDAAAGFRARIELRVRGGGRSLLEFEDGALRLSATDGRPVDCHLSVDPAAYLLLSYHRIGQWKPTFQGKLAAWGRRPWLAIRLSSLFRQM